MYVACHSAKPDEEHSKPNVCLVTLISVAQARESVYAGQRPPRGRHELYTDTKVCLQPNQHRTADKGEPSRHLFPL